MVADDIAGFIRRIMHELRESWRFKCWHRFLYSRHHAACEILQQSVEAERAYDAVAVKQICKWADDDDPLTAYDVREIVTGAFRSLVRAFAIVGEEEELHCVHCGAAVAPTARHLMWDCPSLIPQR